MVTFPLILWSFLHLPGLGSAPPRRDLLALPRLAAAAAAGLQTGAAETAAPGAAGELPLGLTKSPLVFAPVCFVFKKFFWCLFFFFSWVCLEKRSKKEEKRVRNPEKVRWCLANKNYWGWFNEESLGLFLFF